MASKVVHLADVGPITLHKRRGARHIRLSVAGGQVRVSMPFWAPYKIGADFALQRLDWIRANYVPETVMSDGMGIGKSFTLRFVRDATLQKPKSRVGANFVRISLPTGMQPTDPEAQKSAVTAAQRALKIEAEDTLPSRVREIAERFGFSYKSIEVKRLKGRWGSCSHQKELVFNSFLMQLPWELIDYVIVHELVHTQVMAHGPGFWGEVAKYVPNLPAKRKLIKTFHPVLFDTREQ